MFNAQITTIKHEDQRYETVGDWLFSLDEKNLEVKVSAMSDWRYEFLVGLHELVEAALCKQRGIKEEDVSNFDKEFEAKRVEGNIDEPGNSPDAPYFNEHLIATHVEKLIAAQLGVDWNVYDDEVMHL